MESNSTARDYAGLDEATLVSQLNQMLHSINLPLSLISPTDLTPSLLIAILESVLCMRISLVDRNKESKNSKHANIYNMKIFLGVLETDILNSNVDLSDIDPRRLADGEWNEVYYIGELLCWIGRKLGLIGKPKRDKVTQASFPPQISSGGPSRQPVAVRSAKSRSDMGIDVLLQGGSTSTGSTMYSHGSISIFPNASNQSETSLFASAHVEDSDDEYLNSDGLSNILGDLSPFKKPEPISPQCIHGLVSPLNSLLLSTDSARPTQSHLEISQDRYSPPISNRLPNPDASIDEFFSAVPNQKPSSRNSSIRYSGFIEPVDEESELQSFELSRSIQLSRQLIVEEKPSRTVKSQYTRTLELLNERAQLLTQLAELKTRAQRT